jgi:L-aminopeptidase/D-esterase-like protein
LRRSGRCEGPICITNTHSCGCGSRRNDQWLVERTGGLTRALPVTGDFDGYLNDINGLSRSRRTRVAALDSRGGAIEEGSVGGGTGIAATAWRAFWHASRVVEFADGRTSSARSAVQLGRREQLTIGASPGAALKDWEPDPRTVEVGSVIAIIGTDAPLLAHQLKRLAPRQPRHRPLRRGFATLRRHPLVLHGEPRGVARPGAVGGAGVHSGSKSNPFFEAVIQATDEAVIDSMVANETMQGCDDHVVHALPHDEVLRLLGLD